MKELPLNKLPKRVLASLDLETVFKASRCVVAAERLMIFRNLQKRPLSASAVGKRVGLHERHCESFLDYLVFLGLLRKTDNLYSNSVLANRYFIQERSIEWTRFWSAECAKDFEALTVVDEALSSGRDWREILGKNRKRDYELTQQDPEWAAGFAYALYDDNKADAETLADHLDLTNYRSLLDVGGGSGVMSIALARANPQLKACVLDFEYVCKAAKEIIHQEHLSNRIRTLTGDMNETIPGGYDVIMFWEIGHIDTRVMKMAFESLPTGGMLVRSCRPSGKSQTPSPSGFLNNYFGVRPEHQTKTEKIESIKSAGFTTVKYRALGQGMGMITAIKN
ncbi:MAG: methyltransferase [Candidatus Zixiibacteriota bacterium]|nr:MAG: methyltransferase [candidate division Zixibacteria bacterium]